MYNKNDRISENYNKIIAIFHQLFLVNPYESISIQKIAEEAGMTRVNFYNYFVDKEDLLYKTYIYLYREMESNTPPVDPVTLLADGKSLTYYALENVKQNKIFYKQMFQDTIPSSLTYRILDFITDESFRTHEMLRKLYIGTEVPYKMINRYLAGALWNLIRELVNESNDWDSETISHFFKRLSTEGLQSYLQNKKES
ncbi:AcrR family transcriptional regulator [Leptospira ryugenii]|uniref:AcrR family transcriptional regulator n=1 Tax=Leptospira ryugenii TaxID=1917863 RepID=A0A2P2E269_9LEPT|nr:TetR/AcrR family transcriptional regulator [Leptospira ryugenii]GBF50934.1 AcrR family transcriptional regulator [Leptospira ryugenii]